MNLNWIDGLLFIGTCVAVVLFLAYCISAVKLFMTRKKSPKTEGKALKCTLIQKWAYTAVEVKYSYVVDGKAYQGFSSVKGVIRPAIQENTKIEVYYNPDDPSKSFLEAEFKTILKSLLVLGILIICAGLSCFWGKF